ncbi:hypothetical protein Agub_g6543 [Astrephomene gubernaculifera]|uniref:Uncharacterized protein n=1 Tax=Astrephomene gubernaculifera TaxID=47775 RepID=A0AAD3DQ45_9CHLO|nr:hypothetical protein Agub_g6543 [Astrephomene gubernaculifera]
MTESLVHAASRLAECCALLAIGYNLKQTGVLRSSDGETAIKLASTLTLPSVIIQAFGNGPPLGPSSLSLVGVASVCLGAQLAATWLYCAQRPPRERAVLSGSCTGLELGGWGYPLAAILLMSGPGGPHSGHAAGGAATAAGALGAGAAAAAGWGPGAAAAAAGVLQCVALVDMVNMLAVWLGSYLLSAGAGPAFPAAFPHEDGGSYRGQWRGMRKEGLGVYTYASGARYEGEWRNNVKEGRGVYHFPKGGVYEGEWSNGSMNGLGVRTLSSGQVKAGRWRDGVLETPLELWQVALAADGAAAVAAAARSVEVGGGRLVDAAQQLAAQPGLWALLAGLGMNAARVALPPWLSQLTAPLAAAHAPLMLLAAGLTAPQLPAALKALQGPLLPDLARLLGARLLVPLSVGLLLLLDTMLSAAAAGVGAAGAAGGGFGAVLGLGSGFGLVPAGALLPLAATLMALLAPVTSQGLVNARRFRLNEQTAAAISAASLLTSVPLMLLAGIATCITGVTRLPSMPPPPTLPYSAAAVAVAVNAWPLAAFAAAAIAAVAAAVRYATRSTEYGTSGGQRQEAGDRRVRMVYVGPVEPPATSAAAPATMTSAGSEASHPVSAGAGASGVEGAGGGSTASSTEAAAGGSSGGGGGGGRASGDDEGAGPSSSGTGSGGCGSKGGPGARGPGATQAVSQAAPVLQRTLAGAATASCWGRQRSYGRGFGAQGVRHGSWVAAAAATRQGSCTAAATGASTVVSAQPARVTMAQMYGRSTATMSGCVVRRSYVVAMARRLQALRRTTGTSLHAR